MVVGGGGPKVKQNSVSCNCNVGMGFVVRNLVVDGGPGRRFPCVQGGPGKRN